MRKLVTMLRGPLAVAALFAVQVLAAQTCPSGKISGRVFQDFNFNGLADEAGPTGLAGVDVLLYKPLAGGGSVADGSTVTDANGDYAFTGKTDGLKYRVEFVLPPGLAALQAGFFGAANKTDVQFVTAPSCSVDAAFAEPGDFCSQNPPMVTPCYVNGDPIAGGDAGPARALVGFPYAATGSGQGQHTTVGTIASVGACWGLAFQKESKTLFSASVLRRHSGFGPGGPGAIYVHDVSNFAAASKIATIDLAALGIPVGADPRTGNPLPPNIITPSHDSLAFPLIGKFGIGDIDLSSDGKDLWVMCLSNRTLYKIFVNNPFAMPTAANVTPYPLADPGCGGAAGDWRPWGLKAYRGEVYVGIVCTAESTQSPAGMVAHVKKLNGSGGFDPVFSFPLNYTRGKIIDNAAMNHWNPWTNNWALITATGGNGNYPQPLLSDIEFDVDGSMILGFLDRTAMQGGYLNYGPGYQYSSPMTTFSGGDIVRVCKNASGGFDLEGSTAACKTPLGQSNGEGPGGGEYYWDESFENSFSNAGNPFVVHHETALGGLALVPGKGEVASGAFDPLGFNTGGVSWYNNTTGKCAKSYEIYPALPGFAGKSAGVGDLEALCPPAPIEKGNFVWEDLNKDGVQDPNEPPLPGVNVSLYDIDCQEVATVVTNAQGEYYFNKTTIGAGDSIRPGATYYIVVGTGGQWDNGLLSGSLTLSPANTGFGPGADLNDSDGQVSAQNCTGGLPFAQFTASKNGGDHACDFGFFVACSVSLDAVLVKNETCLGSKDGQLTITASGPASIEYSINGGQTFQPGNVFSGLMPGSYNIVVQETGNPDCSASTSRTLLPGIVVGAPTGVLPFTICQNEVALGGGLSANCQDCPAGLAQNTTWWTAQTGGTMVGSGSPFDPAAAGAVNPTVPGPTTFWAQCACGPCTSPRVAAVFTVLALPTPTVTGEQFPCPGATQTYTTPFHNGSGWMWSVPTGGQIISSNQNTAVVKWGATPGGPHFVRVTETDDRGCAKTDQLSVEIRPTAIVCKSHLNVSLNETCTAVLTPQLLLEGNYPTFSGYTVSITDANGNPIQGNKITGTGFWKFKVTEPCIGNSCWGDLTTEDKFPPKINYQTLTVPCSQSNVDPLIPNLSAMPTLVNIGGTGGVTVEDNCGITGINYHDALLDFDCASTSGFSAKISRTWVATDLTGNTGTCVQMIFFQRKYLADVMFPGDFTTQACENQNIPPQVTGVPTVNGLPLWPSSAYCELNAVYADQFFPICDGSMKVIRTWTVLDWCLPVSATNPKNYIQIIKFLDKTGPQFDCPASFEASTQPADCSASVNLPDVFIHDNCSRIKSATAQYKLGGGSTATVLAGLQKATGPGATATDTMAVFPAISGLPLGAHVITYTVEDDCGNSSKCSFSIFVKDGIPPVAVCQEYTQVAVGNSGVAVVDAESFNSGSYDHCAPVFFKVKRMLDSECVGPAENQFGDFTRFCCSDVNDSVQVILRVYQEDPGPGPVADDLLEGKYNECMVVVFVEDKVKPVCAVPGNVTVECAAFDPTLWSYGDVAVIDNCKLDTTFYSVNTTQFNASCKSGSLVRTWIVRDAGGNTAKCSQKVTVEPKTDFWVKFPDDVVLTDCAAGGDYGAPVVTGDNCEVIAISSDDDVFTLQTDACFKIFRTWTIVNWCDYDPSYNPVEIGNPDDSTLGATAHADHDNHGYLRYTQVIKVNDNTDPVVDCPVGPVTFEDYTDNDPTLWNFNGHDQCEGAAPLTIRGHDLCAGSSLVFGYILKLDLDGDGTMETNWNSNQPGNPAVDVSFDPLTGEAIGSIEGLVLPYGIHLVKWVVEDGCGNQTLCEHSFEIKDAKKPTVTCVNGLSVNSMQNGSVTLWASDFLKYATDNCTKPADLIFRIRKTGTGSGLPSEQSVTFGCSEIGTQTVELWAKDKAGNADFCATYVIISDNTGACNTAGSGSVAGFIKTKNDEGVEAVSVKITGSQAGLPAPDVFTGANGAYNFSALPLGKDYLVTPEKDVNPLNGISTFDLVAMSKHILNVAPFGQPWQFLAADINHNGQVTTFDVVELRKLILGIYSDFPQNTSWRFVDKNFSFDMAQNPLSQPFGESISIQNLQNGSDLGDFVAVKIGDVNFDALPNNLSEATERGGGKPLFFEMEEKEIEAGQPVEATFRAADLAGVEGWQFTLGFDKNALEFEGIAPGRLPNLGLENFGLNRLGEGLLTTSWNGPTEGMGGGEPLFTLRFLAKKNGGLSQSLRLGSEVTPAEGYARSGAAFEPKLLFHKKDGGAAMAAERFEAFQNEPNPFSESTRIGFNLPVAGAVSLRVFDAQGRTVLEKTGDFGRGRSAFEVSKKEVGGAGLYFYEIRTGGGESAVRKFLVE